MHAGPAEQLSAYPTSPKLRGTATSGLAMLAAVPKPGIVVHGTRRQEWRSMICKKEFELQIMVSLTTPKRQGD